PVDLARVARVQPLSRRRVDARALPQLPRERTRLRRLPLPGLSRHRRGRKCRSGLRQIASSAFDYPGHGPRPGGHRRREAGLVLPGRRDFAQAFSPKRKKSRMNAPQAAGVSVSAPVSAAGLSKRYGELAAVDGLDLAIAPGEFFGLLGPNGSGKTTTMHMLATLIRPSAGRAAVAGFDVVSAPVQVRSSIGLVFQESALDR